jgi:predicted glycosyltransferase
MRARPSLLFYCQHSLGMGHLMRSVALTRSLAQRFQVTFVSGGRLPRHVRLDRDVRIVALPAVGMDASGALVSHDRRRLLDRALAERRRILLETFHAVSPDIVLIELFPFGRRKFRAELEPVLDEVRAASKRRRAIVCCSVRDILVGREDQREHDERTAMLLGKYFDAVLVHSDPAFALLEESLSPGVRMPVPFYYTGFVHDGRAIRPASAGRGRLVASAGGGVVGEQLFRTVLEAHARPEASHCPPLTIVAGPFLPAPAWAALESVASRGPRVLLRRSVPSLPAMLAEAAGSISQCGYNTAMDLIATGVPALVIPFLTDKEDEQIKRARRLESLGAVRLLMPEDAKPRRVAREMAALRDFRPRPASLDLDGAERSARMLVSLRESGLPVERSRSRAREVRV